MPIQTKNPYTNKIEKTFTPINQQEIHTAIFQAHEAFLEWKETSLSYRKTLMLRVADELRANAKEYASLMTTEMGKLYKEGIEWEIPNCEQMCEYYANNAHTFLAPEFIHDVMQGEAFLEPHPIGVIFGVMPWNFPFYQIIRLLAPNIMAGNVVIFKHASNVPQCAQAIEKLFLKAGFPKSVVTNLLMNSSDAHLVIEDKRVRGISLTGSEKAGSKVASLAGQNLKKSVMELGGSDAFIVLNEVDLEEIAPIALNAKMFNCGEVCTGAKRYIVVENLYDKFLERFKQDMQSLKPGNPMHLDTQYAPMVSTEERDKLLEIILEAKNQGATIEIGGEKEDLEGAWLKPTIITGVTPNMDIHYLEPFGPVAIVYKAKNEQDAIDIANDSPFGLSSSIMCKDIQKAKQLASKLETGVTFINNFTISEPCLPFGGIKNSGFGKELGKLGIEEFINKKLIRTL